MCCTSCNTLQFSAHRHRLYSVFIRVPIGLTVSLASKTITLEGEDEDDGPAQLQPQAVLADGADGGGGPTVSQGGGPPAAKEDKRKPGLSFSPSLLLNAAGMSGAAETEEGSSVRKGKSSALLGRFMSMDPGTAAASPRGLLGRLRAATAASTALSFLRVNDKVRPQ